MNQTLQPALGRGLLGGTPRPQPGAGAALEIGSQACLLVAFLLLLPIGALTIAQVRFGYHSYTLSAEDMAPAIPVGSLVVTHPTPAAELRPGDVIAFHPPGRAGVLVTRRVVGFRTEPTTGGHERLVETRADDAVAPDPWLIPASAVVDRAALAIPWVGYPAAAIQTRVGRFAFLVLPAALLALLFLGQRSARRRPGERALA